VKPAKQVIDFICSCQLTEQTVQRLRAATAEQDHYEVTGLVPGSLLNLFELGPTDSLFRWQRFVREPPNFELRNVRAIGLRRTQPNVAPDYSTIQILRNGSRQFFFLLPAEKGPGEPLVPRD
jgi:hypothetical protein